MLESFWNLFSFDLLPTLPIRPSPRAFFLLFITVFFPSYIAYAKQSLKRRAIYRFSMFLAVFSAAVLFIPLERHYISLDLPVVFAKTLYVLLLVFAIFDQSSIAKKYRFFKRYISYPLESLIVHLMYWLCKILPPAVASGMGGLLGRFLSLFAGKFNRLAAANFKIAFPKMKPDEIVANRSKMWDMLGRYITEPAHFKYLFVHHKKYIEIQGDEVIEKLKGKPFIIMVSHSGSVGLITIPFALHGNVPSTVMYQKPTNYLTDGITKLSFGDGIGKTSYIHTDAEGTRAAMRLLSRGGTIVTASDHRVGDVKSMFFGKKVLSPAGIVKMSAHYNCPILPVQIIRKKGLYHKIVFHKPFIADKDLDKAVAQMNSYFEDWIRENPSQWFWVHNRWDLKDY